MLKLKICNCRCMVRKSGNSSQKETFKYIKGIQIAVSQPSDTVTQCTDPVSQSGSDFMSVCLSFIGLYLELAHILPRTFNHI